MSFVVQSSHILIVEDEAIVARDIATQILALGYKVAGMATSGEQAISLAEERRPDLVVMDIQLGSAMDGIVAAQVIRERFSIPIVFLTAFDADDILGRAKLSEPFGYILKPFSERELRAVLAMALYKHQAEAKLLTSTRQLQALSRSVLEAQELERRRVAMELHDELGQSLTAIKINLQMSARVAAMPQGELNAENIRIVEAALQHVRRLATALRPSLLDDLGLAPALKWIAEQTANRCGFAVRFHQERDLSRLAPEIETACFRIVQEALTNVARYAQPSKVEIRLLREAGTLVLSVSDDGCGFDLMAMRARAAAGGSLGVLGMQERATLIGGELNIQSSPAQGCLIELRCPWRTHEEPAG